MKTVASPSIETSVPTIERLELRLPAERKAEIEDAAALLGISVSALVLEATLTKARAVKADHNRTLLFGEDAGRFAELLENPPAPTPALVETLRRRASI